MVECGVLTCGRRWYPVHAIVQVGVHWVDGVYIDMYGRANVCNLLRCVPACVCVRMLYVA